LTNCMFWSAEFGLCEVIELSKLEPGLRIPDEAGFQHA